MSTPLAKSLLGEISPWMLAGLLYAGSGAGLMLPLLGRALWARRGSSLALPKPEEWRWLAGAIFFGGVLGPVALMYGLQTTAASTASLLLNLEAVFTALLAWFLFSENFDRRIVVGMIAIVAGGAVLAWTPAAGRGSFGLALIAAACLFWALDNNLTRKASASDAVVIASLKGFVAGVVNLGLALALGHRLPAFGIAAAAAGIGFLGYGVSLALFVLALRHLGSARAGAYFAVAPFFGAALAIVLLGEAVSWQIAVAGVLMAPGVWLHATERHDHLHAHEHQEHTHTHVHDEHHRHEHDFAWDGTEPHAHAHVHLPLVHAHPHFPDVHHRHPH
jgi:drug/metabolite transporter (DMT)-like permease